MDSTPILGDSINNNSNDIKIIKEVVGDSGEVTYLVQVNNVFRYHLERMPSNEDPIEFKRRKKGSSRSSESITSLPSAPNWCLTQKKLFNLHFYSELSSQPSHDARFMSFFSNDVPCTFPDILKNVLAINLYHNDPSHDNITNPILQQLVHQSRDFQLYQNEAASEDFFKTILILFKEHSMSKVKLRYGIADLLLSRTVKGSTYMFCAVEIKGAAPYDAFYREKCRTQLAAYMVSMAVENYEKLIVVNENERFGSQQIFGILLIGLTPIFYRANIDDVYIEAILDHSFDGIPELKIHEFVPVDPYNDREFLNPLLRPILIKSFQTLLSHKF